MMKTLELIRAVSFNMKVWIPVKCPSLTGEKLLEQALTIRVRKTLLSSKNKINIMTSLVTEEPVLGSYLSLNAFWVNLGNNQLYK